MAELTIEQIEASLPPMTREELCAVIDEVLDATRTTPGRRHTILAAVDHYTAAEVCAAYDRGYDNGHGDADDETSFHAEMADRIARGEL